MFRQLNRPLLENMDADVPPAKLNRNRYWMNNKGAWLTWIFAVFLLHFFLMCMPFFSTPTAWTLTHVIHNVVRVSSVCLRPASFDLSGIEQMRG